MTKQYVCYRPEVEILLEDENQIIDDILASMHRLNARTSEMYGHSVRVSHAKSYGLATGELTVLDNLPDYLAQGLFSQAGTYPIIVRLSNAPGEVLSDAVNTQRGFVFKILGVEGTKLAGHEGQTTQDFVLDTGNRFIVSDSRSFLMQHRMIEHAPQLPDAVKEAVSTLSRISNAALHAVGTDSAKLDFFGDSRIHPLAEAYFSQAPIRYGQYIAKLAVVPVSTAQKAMMDAHVSVDGDKDANALRTATVGYLNDHDAEFDLRIQLCTDLETMPIEDGNKEWKEEESPYLTVARIHLPKQDAYSPARQQYIEALSFCVSHCLEAHRPLGSIMRARLRAYPELSRLRRQTNNQPLAEPTSIQEVPAE